MRKNTFRRTVSTAAPVLVNSFDASKLPALNSETLPILEMARTGKNLRIQAGAGVGKTTTLKRLAFEVFNAARVLYLVFNKKNQIEAVASMPPNVESSTIHSVALRYGAHGYKVISDSRHVAQQLELFIKPRFEEDQYKEFYNQLADMERCCRLSKTTLSGFSIEALTRLVSDYGLCLDSRVVDLLSDYLTRNAQKVVNLKTGDFDDLLHYVATHKTLNAPTYDCVMIDEAQDVSAAGYAVFRQVRAAQYIAVGDACQSINGFAGALRQSMAQTFSDSQELPMLTSHRCPVSHCELANQYRLDGSKLIPSQSAIMGTIEGINFSAFKSRPPIMTGLILARTNAELVTAAIKCYTLGLPFQFNPEKNPLKAIARPLYSRLRNNKADIAASEFGAVFEAYITEYADHETTDENDLTAASVEFARYCLDSNVQTTKELYRLIDCFTESTTGPMLSTVHGAKGLEHETVILLNVSNMGPNRKKGLSEYDRAQETNLFHVALTRSKSVLIMLDLAK